MAKFKVGDVLVCEDYILEQVVEVIFKDQYVLSNNDDCEYECNSQEFIDRQYKLKLKELKVGKCYTNLFGPFKVLAKFINSQGIKCVAVEEQKFREHTLAPTAYFEESITDFVEIQDHLTGK